MKFLDLFAGIGDCAVVIVGLAYCIDKKLDDTQNEWKQIVVKQGEYIKKLAEHNKAQDVIINKLNAEYNLKGKNHE